MMKKHSVLIVDDEPLMLRSLAELLEKEFHILTASNGKDGFLSFKTNDALSLILLDMDMPVMNGFEMLQGVREISSDVKVIIMTGGDCRYWSMRCAELGVEAYIQKPLDVKQLISRMKKLLDADSTTDL